LESAVRCDAGQRGVHQHSLKFTPEDQQQLTF
jgi:hypothetical protein